MERLRRKDEKNAYEIKIHHGDTETQRKDLINLKEFLRALRDSVIKSGILQTHHYFFSGTGIPSFTMTSLMSSHAFPFSPGLRSR